MSDNRFPQRFNPLDFDCPACPAKVLEFCDRDWPTAGDGFVPTFGFTHEQRTSYNLLADHPADGVVPSKKAFADAVRKSERI